ncbi:MAG TPA: hypothetical protein VF834_22825 [Streptosporangiaceae bacterium]
MHSDTLLDRKIALVTCMDPRIRLGHSPGVTPQAFVLRNAGGRVTDDVVRGLLLCTRVIEVTEIGVLHHNDCRLHGTNNIELGLRTGVAMDYLPFADLAESVRDDVSYLRSRMLFSTTPIWGGLYDVDSQRIEMVVDAAPLAQN